MISAENLSIQFSGEYLFHSASFKINSGDKIGVVGPNGCGKTTLLRLIAGIQEPESGSFNFQSGISIGYLPQDYISEDSDKSLFDEVYRSNSKLIELEVAEKNLLHKLRSSQDQSSVKKLGEVQEKIHEINPEVFKSNIKKILTGLGFNESDFTKNVSLFSGGWKMRIALSKILLSDPDILLLDEPTNHLDLDSLEFLIKYLQRFSGAIMIVSHDQHFLNTITQKTLGFSFDTITMYNGNVKSYLEAEESKREQLIASYKNQQQKIKQIERFIERFRYKATKARQVQSRIKMLDKIEKIDLLDEDHTISFNFNNSPRSGKVVLRLERVSKSFGDHIVFDEIELEIDREDKIAIVGINGSGKTTLSKIIADEDKIDSGEKILGHNVMVGYFSQDIAENLDLNISVIETVENVDPSKSQRELRTILGCFLFQGDDVFKKVKVLSGGEKSRLALTKILLRPSNFLIMDEPTNHLDINSKKILQDALIDYDGSLLIVSHDVDFLDPIVNKVIEVKDKKIKTYLGNVSEYLAKMGERGSNPAIETKSEGPFGESKVNQKRLQKRSEAEARQKFYQVTKIVKAKIHSIEKEISALEKNKQKIEAEMNDLSFIEKINNQNIFIEYRDLTERLQKLYTDWEQHSNEYLEKENMFFGNEEK